MRITGSDSLLSICHMRLHQVFSCVLVRVLESECSFKVGNGPFVLAIVSETVKWEPVNKNDLQHTI